MILDIDLNTITSSLPEGIFSVLCVVPGLSLAQHSPVWCKHNTSLNYLSVFLCQYKLHIIQAVCAELL